MRRIATRFATALVTSAALTFPLSTATAQDAHYWTLQYGPRSSLLGGAVIGSVDDVSGTYYNPGALGLASDLAFAVSADVFEISGISLEDGGGEGVDLGTSRSGLRPSMVAGTITRSLFGRGVLAYSAVTRARGVHDLAGLLVLSGSDIPDSLQLDDVAGLVQFDGRFNDTWLGVSYSQPLGTHLALGVTWYGAFRSQSRQAETISQAVADDGSGGAQIDIRGGKYRTIRTLFKFGAYGATGPVTGGVTLTTPSIHISGSGELGLNVSAFGTDTVSLATNFQTLWIVKMSAATSTFTPHCWARREHSSTHHRGRIKPRSCHIS